MQVNDIKDIEQILKSVSGLDTRKGINRSSKKISTSVIDEIESVGITTERINALKIPIFKYQGQVTLHGVFDTSDVKFRIGSYQNIIQNKNKTLGIKYDAIDVAKKKRIYKTISELTSFGVVHNSKEWSLSSTLGFTTKKECIEAIPEIKKYITDVYSKGVVAQYNMSIGTYMGMWYLMTTITVLSILEASVDKFIESVLKMSKSEIESKLTEIEAKRKLDNEMWQAKYEKERIADQAKKDAVIKELVDAGYTLQNTYDGAKGYYNTYCDKLEYVECFLPTQRSKKLRSKRSDVIDFKTNKLGYSHDRDGAPTKMWIK